MHKSVHTEVSLNPSSLLLVRVANSLDQLEHEHNLHGELFQSHAKLPIGSTLSPPDCAVHSEELTS